MREIPKEGGGGGDVGQRVHERGGEAGGPSWLLSPRDGVNQH